MQHRIVTTRRLMLALPGLLMPAATRAEEAPLREGRALRPAPGLHPGGAARAAGALVWAHAHYTEGSPPEPPPFTARLTTAGWDLWRLDRIGGRDPLEPGAVALAEGTAALRAEGYRQVVVVGESRGAFIALAALRTPKLADAMLLLAPAAHGTSPARKPQALAAFQAALAAAAPGAVRRAALVLFADDPYDPDPVARGAGFMAAMRADGITPLLLDRPAEPRGHGGARDPEFDARFGARLAGFLDGSGAS
jgi:pimeloyl-ACP methyl ester carboxylesterase